MVGSQISWVRICISIFHHLISHPPLNDYRNPSLEFVAAPALAPPEVIIDLQQQQEIERDLEQAANQPLPAEDGKFYISKSRTKTNTALISYLDDDL